MKDVIAILVLLFLGFIICVRTPGRSYFTNTKTHADIPIRYINNPKEKNKFFRITSDSNSVTIPNAHAYVARGNYKYSPVVDAFNELDLIAEIERHDDGTNALGMKETTDISDDIYCCDNRIQNMIYKNQYYDQFIRSRPTIVEDRFDT